MSPGLPPMKKFRMMETDLAATVFPVDTGRIFRSSSGIREGNAAALYLESRYQLATITWPANAERFVALRGNAAGSSRTSRRFGFDLGKHGTD